MASLAACMDGIDQPDAHFRISYMDVIVCVILDGPVELVDQDAMRSTSIRKEAFSHATLIWTLSLV